MSAVSAPFGFRPAYHPSGTFRPKGLSGGIASAYAANLFIGTPITFTTSGTMEAATTSSRVMGIFAGCQYTPVGGSPVNGMWTSGVSYETGTMIAFYYDDPEIVYAVQANGPVAQAAIGDQADCVNPGNGSTATHLSTAALSSTFVGAGNNAQFRVVGLAEFEDNAWGDAFTIVHVKVAEHQFVADRIAI